MKPTHLLFVFFLMMITACGVFRGTYSSRFVENAPQLGMAKADFVAMYGTPLRQNTFYDENNVYCEELIYRERIDHDGGTFVQGELRAINSIFLFRNGRLESQFQEDDQEYQFQLEKARERRLIQESIDAERERAAAERERAAAEKERIELEKKKEKEEKSN